MSWNVPGVRIQGRDAAEGETDWWRGIDEATGDPVTVHTVPAAASRLDQVAWRAEALGAIEHRGLRAPRRVVAHDGDLLIVYDRTRPIDASGGDVSRVAAAIVAVAGQLHALHLAGMTHGRVDATTVREDAAGDPVLVGTAESVLRAAAAGDTAAGDVRALAALGLNLLRGANADRAGAAQRGLLAILARAVQERPEDAADPCDPAPSADLARECAPFATDEPACSPSERLVTPRRGDYVARHLRPTARRLRSRRKARVHASRPHAVRGQYPARRGPWPLSSGPAVAGCVIAVLIAGCAWIGAAWGGSAGSSPSSMRPAAGPAVQATAHDAPTEASPDFEPGSASSQQWADYLEALYALRTTAILNRDGELLDGVYAPGSPQRDSDLSVIAALTASGATIVGFAPKLVAVQGVSDLGDTFVVQLVDRLPPYTVVDAAGTPTARPGRGDQQVHLSLERSGESWLITTAVRAT